MDTSNTKEIEHYHSKTQDNINLENLQKSYSASSVKKTYKDVPFGLDIQRSELNNIDFTNKNIIPDHISENEVNNYSMNYKQNTIEQHGSRDNIKESDYEKMMTLEHIEKVRLDYAINNSDRANLEMLSNKLAVAEQKNFTIVKVIKDIMSQQIESSDIKKAIESKLNFILTEEHEDSINDAEKHINTSRINDTEEETRNLLETIHEESNIHRNVNDNLYTESNIEFNTSEKKNLRYSLNELNSMRVRDLMQEVREKEGLIYNMSEELKKRANGIQRHKESIECLNQKVEN